MSHQRGTPVNALYHRRLAVLPVRADGLHLTPDGHRFVAERLYEGGMREWVGGLLERRARRASGAHEQQRPLEGSQGAGPPSWLRSRS